LLEDDTHHKTDGVRQNLMSKKVIIKQNQQKCK